MVMVGLHLTGSSLWVAEEFVQWWTSVLLV
jgi:hypothetical protein